MRMSITQDDIRDIYIPLCPQTVMACELSEIATPWEPLQLYFSVERPGQVNVQFSDSKVSSPVHQVSCNNSAKVSCRRRLWKNLSFLSWRFRPQTFCEMIILMFVFFFFLFLAVFIVEVPSDVSGTGRSILRAGSCRFVLRENELSHDTCKLGSVSIGNMFEIRSSNWMMRRVSTDYTKNIFPAFVEF